MKKFNRREFLYLAQILKAIAHPTRLFIIRQLAKREHCVCELKDMVGADMSTISKHLSLLKEAGLIWDDKRKNKVFYTLRCPCVLQFLDCLECELNKIHDLRKSLS